MALELLVWVLQDQFRPVQTLADLRRAHGAEWMAACDHQGTVDACGNAHHVIQDTVVLRILRKTETERRLQTTGDLLPCTFCGCGFSHQLFKIWPLGGVGFTELLCTGTAGQLPQPRKRFKVSCRQCPFFYIPSLCGIY